MYVIIVYDVPEQQNRDVLTYLRTRLGWVQYSVFEAELTAAQLREVKSHLSEVIENQETASVIVYSVGSEQYIDREVLGKEKGNRDRII